MAYLDVIPLDRAKTYLRIDDTQNETDAEITSMIKAACRYVERKTNHIFFARDVNYTVVCGNVRVYDYPINNVVAPVGQEGTKGRLYTTYCTDNEVDEITLNVGYIDPLTVPDDLIEVALVLVNLMYFQSEEDQNFNDMIPVWAKEILENNRRFLL